MGKEALAIAVFVSLVTDSLEDALSLAVSHGGDSDSAGAITGNIIGAAFGPQAIPARWLAALELRDKIEYPTNRLAELDPWPAALPDA